MQTAHNNETTPSAEQAHRLMWAAHAFASTTRLRILQALRPGGRVKKEVLRANQWDGLFDLSLDALVRSRVVEESAKYVWITPFGQHVFEALETACEAASPTH